MLDIVGSWMDTGYRDADKVTDGCLLGRSLWRERRGYCEGALGVSVCERLTDQESALKPL